MELKAQVVKCSLFGVYPVKASRFVYHSGCSDSTLLRYMGAHAVAIFSEVKAGTVGMVKPISSGDPKEPKSMEQCAFVTL